MLPAFALVAQAALLPPAPPAPYPFHVGETLRYTASLGYLPIGSAAMSVSGVARERGAETFVLTMSGQGGPPGLGVSYQMTSWVGTEQFTSRRFHRHVVQAGQVSDQRFLIFPDSSRYREEGKPQAWLAPPDPLDELAFLYFLRSVPLKVGQSYNWSRYFQTGFNPVQALVTGREPLALPDGRRVPCFVLQVTTRAGASQIWITDDTRRLPAQARVPFTFGEVTFRLAEVTAR